MLKSYRLLGVIIFLVAFIFRVTGLNWDNGYHFHPDERMLIMVADNVQLFSQMNPDFFNYGSLPIYLLKGTSQIIDSLLGLNTGNYDGLLYVGRWLSTITDMFVLFLVYKIAQLVFRNSKIALWSMFFYAMSFFPIQNTHFFVVDVYLNFFATLLLYLLLRYHQMPSWKGIILISITYAAALTTKVSAIIFLPVIIMVIVVSHMRRLAWWRRLLTQIISIIFPNRGTEWKEMITQTMLRTALFLIITMGFAYIFMPYAFIESERFLRDIGLQTTMNSDPYIFPYTLQYVGTIPYLYYLKNIFLWGVGPAIGILSILGILDTLFSHFKTIRAAFRPLPDTFKKMIYILYHILDNTLVIMLIFYLLYFVVIGQSAVKFMRYMLLLYPLITIFAGVGAVMLEEIRFKIRQRWVYLPIVPLLSIIAVFWTLAFVSLYTKENTRITATKWINQNIPVGAKLAVEHWDDRVPIFDPGKYEYIELTLYDQPDNDFKWAQMNEKLNSADYIVIASNRLYVPLQKLNDCNSYQKCYPLTAQYYQDLFDGKRGFTKIAEFASYPHLSFGSWTLTIPDDAADESFTVYDHPKIMVFKKNMP